MKRNVRKQYQVDFEASLVPRCFLGFPEVVVGFPCPFAFLRIPMILASRLPLRKSQEAPGYDAVLKLLLTSRDNSLLPNALLWGRKGAR